MRIIGEQDLRKVVHEREAFEAVARAFRALAEDRVEQPPPMSFDFPDCAGEVHVKGAAIRGAPIFAVKIVSGFYRNPEGGLPTSSGLVLVLSQSTGAPLALFQDNAFLTEMRTAAAGALAVELLTPKSTDRMAVLGSGAQARYQLRAIVRVRTLRSVSVWSPTRAHAERYCAEMQKELGIPFTATADATEAVRDASLVLTVTSAREPIVRLEDVLASATLIAVGSDGPAKQELDEKILAKADKIIVDRRSQCAALGELHHALVAGLVREGDVYAELGDIVVGRKAGREANELIVCDLTGVGVQDAAIAETAWRALTSRDAPGR